MSLAGKGVGAFGNDVVVCTEYSANHRLIDKNGAIGATMDPIPRRTEMIELRRE